MRRANPVPPALLVAIPVVIVVGAVMAFAASEDPKPAKKPAQPGGGLGAGFPGFPPPSPRAPVEEEEQPCQEGWHRSTVTGQCLPPRAEVEEQEEPPARAPINRARAGTKTQAGGGGGPPGTTEKFDIAQFVPGQSLSTVRQDAVVPNVKGDYQNDYNYALYHNQSGLTPIEALRYFMLMIGYEMEQLTFGNLQPDSSKLIGSEPQQVNKFQGDWNAVVKALDSGKMGASSSHPFFDDMRGLLSEGLSNFSGLESGQLNTNQKATLRALEIAARAQEEAADTPSLEWQSLVNMS